MSELNPSERHDLQTRLETLARLGAELTQNPLWGDTMHLEYVRHSLSPDENTAEALTQLDQALDVLRKVS
jgi:hypothetical protein